MPAKFYTDNEIIKHREKALKIAQQHVENAYKDIGKGFGTCLFKACMRTWACGPATTVSRLNGSAFDVIKKAWVLKDDIAGVMLIREGVSITPLYLHQVSLAYKLAKKGNIQIDFAEIKKELENDPNCRSTSFA